MTSAQAGLVLQHLRRLAGTRRAVPSPDRQLLERFTAQRDEAAFADLVRRHGPMVLNVCRSVLRHEQDAEDAFQATFLVLARKADSIRQPETIAGWLFEVAQHLAIKAQAAAARRRDQERRASPMMPADPTLDMTLRDLRRVLHEELQRLPDKYRLPLVLCYLEGRSQEEAAIQLGCSKGTFRGRLDRGREHLRRRLAARGVALSALLCAMVTAPNTMAETLVDSVVRAASGDVSARASALAEGVIRTMYTSKLKFVTALLLAVGLVATGAGVLAHQALAAREQAPAIAKSPDQSQEPPAKDVAKPSPADEKGDNIEVSGRVVRPDGQPMAGARLYLNYYTPKKQDHPVRATSGDDGRFRFTFPRAEFDPSAPGSYGFSVLAAADGYAPDWSYRAPQEKEGELTFRLVKDHPIEGRILDVDGRPVKGATLRVEQITAYADVAAFLQTVRDREWPLVENKSWGGPFPGQPKVLTTGADGRFKLTGGGRDREVQFQLEGPGIQYGPVRALAREMKAPVEPRPAHRYEGRVIHKVHGATFDFIPAPSRPIRGVVRDKKTGQPVAGVDLRADGSTHRTRSDQAGRYELLGCPKSAEGYRVSTMLTGQLYFSTSIHLPDTPGLAPVQADIELVSGILVKGRVTHRVTGKPIAGARVHYNPLVPNPHVRLFGPNGAGAVPCSWTETQADGSYNLVVLPGPGMLGVMANSRTETFMPALLTAQELKDFLKGGGLRNDEDTLGIQSGANSFTVVSQGEFHHLSLIEPAEKDESLTRDVTLQPAQPLHGKVLGPDGKPFAGVRAYNLAPGVASQPLEAETFTVEGLNPRRKRHLAFLTSDRKLGAFRTILGEVKEPLTIRLEPVGSVTGRLIDDGQPVAGVTVRLEPEQLDYYTPSKVKTDAAGRFRIEVLLPGEKYQARLGPGPFGQYLFAPFTIKPGESKDLGDVQRKPVP